MLPVALLACTDKLGVLQREQHQIHARQADPKRALHVGQRRWAISARMSTS